MARTGEHVDEGRPRPDQSAAPERADSLEDAVTPLPLGGTRPTGHAGAPPDDGAVGSGAGRSTARLNPRALLSLQRSAGNGAVAAYLRTSGPVVQRSTIVVQRTRLRDRINEALDGWGADSNRVIREIGRATAAEKAEVLRDVRLMARMRSEMSQRDGLRALEALGARLTVKLDVAMAGWGAASREILSMIGAAPADQKQEVLRDPRMMSRLRSELSRADAVTAMERLDAPLGERLRAAMSGWGVDAATVMRLIRGASAAQREAALRDRALLQTLRSELSRSDMLRALEALGASLNDRINAAMDGGWGVDSDAILTMARGATADQKRAVLQDSALIRRLRGALSRADMLRLLGHIDAPLAERIDVALSGWGADVASITSMITGAPAEQRMAAHDDVGLLARLQGELSEASYWQVRLLLRFGSQAQIDAPSAAVPALTNGVWYRTDVHIRENQRPEALRAVVAALERGGALSRAAYTEIVYDASGSGEGLTTVTGFDHDAAAGRWTARSKPRVTVHPVGFADVGWLYATIMHEYEHVKQFNNGYNADPNSAVVVAADEVEAYLWEVEHANDSGVANNGPQMRDVGRRLTSHFNRLDAAHKAIYQARYTAAMAIVAAAPAGGPAAPTQSPMTRISTELQKPAPDATVILDAIRTATPQQREQLRGDRPLIERLAAALGHGDVRTAYQLLGVSFVDRVTLLLDQSASAADVLALLRGATDDERASIRNNRAVLDRLMGHLGDTDAQAALTALGDNLVSQLDRALRSTPPVITTLYAAIRAAPQAQREEVEANSALMLRIRSAFRALEYWKVRLLLRWVTEASFPPGVTAIYNVLDSTPTFAAIRRTIANMTTADLDTAKDAPGLRDVLAAHVPDQGNLVTLMRMISEGLITEENDLDRSFTEQMLAGPTTAPFTLMEFTGGGKMDVAYFRDKLEVTVRINVQPNSGDSDAARLLPGARRTWEGNILNGWNNKFRVRNGVHDLPVEFNPVFTTSNAHQEVTAHSGVPQWPGLNMSNWFVPDPVNNPGGMAYVSHAATHEFGHMIGEPDEYDMMQAHYVSIVGSDPTTDPNATSATDTAGTTRYTNRNSVMGGHPIGSVIPGPVQRRHLTYFLGWINRNRRRDASGAPAEPAFTLV